MATIRTKLKEPAIAGTEGVVYFQITHERRVRILSTDYRIYPDEWDARRSVVVIPPAGTRGDAVCLISESIHWDRERLSRIIARLDTSGQPYEADDVIDEFRSYTARYSLSSYMKELISRMKDNGKVRTSETYAAALNSFMNFRGNRDIMLDTITPEMMESYEAWLKRRGICSNTVSFYTRILRAVYNRAVESGVMEDRNPFRHVYTGVDKTMKRALPLRAIKKIKALDLLRSPRLDFARDMFMLSFYLRGMSFIDMAFLRKPDLNSGYVVYRRRKTGQQLVIRWTKEMQQILDKYPENESEFLLPVIKRQGINHRTTYRNMSYNINRNLKEIARMVGVDIPLTLYVARHSWASAAKAKGVPVGVISEGMGHDSENTTRIYLSSLDNSVVDNANSLILRSLG